LQCFIGEGIKTARGHIVLKLAVPHAGVELREPGAEQCQVLGRQLTDCVFDLLDTAHPQQPVPFTAARRSARCNDAPFSDPSVEVTASIRILSLHYSPVNTPATRGPPPPRPP